MKQSDPLHLVEDGKPHPGRLREIFGDAVRFWEPRRITYNSVLAVVVAGWVAATWPHFRNELKLSSLLLLFVLGALANLCYSAAYLVDVPLQRSSWRTGWQLGRRGLWITGTVIAIVLANYWIADEIYPYVQ